MTRSNPQAKRERGGKPVVKIGFVKLTCERPGFRKVSRRFDRGEVNLDNLKEIFEQIEAMTRGFMRPHPKGRSGK